MKFSFSGKIILCFCLLCGTISGQDISLKGIGEISFLGLEKTKRSFINNILDVKVNDSLDLVRIERDLQILKNLPSIAQASFQIDSSSQQTTLTYSITERRTALPIINFGGIRGNVWFSVGAIENNFTGQGDLALAYYQNNNGRHAGQVYYKKPRILGSEWGYSFTLNKWSSDEPVFFETATVDYLYNNNGLGASLIRNFGLNYQIELGGTYFVESYEKNFVPNAESLPGPDDFSIKKALFKLELKQNQLNYDYFYLKGIETLITYQNVVSINYDDFFNSLQLQMRSFLRPKRLWNIAMRLKLGVSTNNDSPFAPFVADSHVNIRGIGNRIDRGTAQLVFNFESRHTLFHHNHVSSQFVAFADFGSWRNPGGQLSDIFDSDQFREFVGIGFRLNYQKVFGATLRVDYGVDVFNPDQRGFVIGLGQYY